MKQLFLIGTLVLWGLTSFAQDAAKIAVGQSIDDSIRTNGLNKITAITLNNILHRINNLNIDSLQAINAINGQKGLVNGIAQLISNLVPLSELPQSVDSLYALNDSTITFLIHQRPHNILLRGDKPPIVDTIYASNDSTLTFSIANNTYNVLIRGSQPFFVAAANNGLSLQDSAVQLGQPVGTPGNPADLTGNMEVPVDGFNFQFTDSASASTAVFSPGTFTMSTAGSTSPYNIFMTTNGASVLSISDPNNGLPILGLSEPGASGRMMVDASNQDRLSMISTNPSTELQQTSGLYVYPGTSGLASIYASTYLDPNSNVINSFEGGIHSFFTPARIIDDYQQAFVALNQADDEATFGPPGQGTFAALSQTWNTTTSPTLILGNVINYVTAGDSSKLLDLQLAGTSAFSVYGKTGHVAIGNYLPTAMLHLPSGGSTAGSAPLKFTGGSLLSTPETGAVEFAADKAYLTISTGAARKEVTLNDAALTPSYMPYATTNGRLTNSNLTYDPSYGTYVMGIPGYSYRGDGTVPMDDRIGVQYTNLGAATSSNLSAPPPGLFFEGTGYNGTTGAVQNVQFGNWVEIIAGSAAPVGVYTISSKVGGSLPSIIEPYTNLFTVNSLGYGNLLTGLYIGNTSTQATAKLQLAPGTTAPGTAPLKLSSGPVLTTPEDGAVEYDGTNYYAGVGTTRYTLSKTLRTTESITFEPTASQSSTDATFSLAGVVPGDAVSVGPPAAAMVANVCYTAWVSASGVVSVRLNNYSSATVSPPGGTFTIVVLK